MFLIIYIVFYVTLMFFVLSFFLYLLIGDFNVDFRLPSRTLFSKLQCIGTWLDDYASKNCYYAHGMLALLGRA